MKRKAEEEHKFNVDQSQCHDSNLLGGGLGLGDGEGDGEGDGLGGGLRGGLGGGLGGGTGGGNGGALGGGPVKKAGKHTHTHTSQIFAARMLPIYLYQKSAARTPINQHLIQLLQQI